MFVRKARASVPFFGITVVTFLAVLVSVLAACQQSQQAKSRDAKGTTASIEKKIASGNTEQELSSETNEVVLTKEIAGVPPATFSVKYRQGEDAICTLEISEDGKVVAENSSMIECELLPSPGMVEVEISGDAKGVTVFQQKTKQNNTYFLQKNRAGKWVITKIVFVYPQDNLQTGDVDVVREAGDLMPPVPVGEYNRSRVEKSLFKSKLQ